MHMVDPKEIARRAAKKRRAQRQGRVFVVVVSIMAIGLIGGLFYMKQRSVPHQQSTAQDTTTPKTAQATPTVAAQKQTKTKLKSFTGEQFRDLYRSVSYPNTQSFSQPPEITGNSAADAHIRTLAEKRGFALTSIPVSPIVKTGEQLISDNGDDLLQPLAQKSWQDLKAAAKKDGIHLSLISAYRSPKWQRDLFMQRLLANGGNVQQIAAGNGEAAVDATLSMTAVPGYSRHHTGYTVDLYCEDGVAFGSSVCNTWITKNNYEVAKKYGWIPSYPPGANEQGPEPEPWEFVWVGTDLLYE